MDDTRLRCFMSLAQTLNFTRTAKDLYMSQQGVSKAIAKLESEVGFQLIERSTRTVRLTNNGEIMAELFERILSEYDETVERIRMNLRKDFIRIGYMNFIPFFDMIKYAKEIMINGDYPELSLDSARYSPYRLFDKLHDGSVDLIISYSRFVDDGNGKYVIEKLLDFKQYYMFSTDVVLEPGKELETVQSLPFILDEHENEPKRLLEMRKAKERKKWGMKGKVIVANNRDSAYSNAKMGEGVVVGTNLSSMFTSGGMQCIDTGITEQLVVVYGKEHQDDVVKKFVEAVKTVFAERVEES